MLEPGPTAPGAGSPQLVRRTSPPRSRCVDVVEEAHDDAQQCVGPVKENKDARVPSTTPGACTQIPRKSLETWSVGSQLKTFSHR
jgi:hypothetical protein